MTAAAQTSYSPAFIYIVKQALINAGINEEGEEPSAEMYDDALRQTNLLIKEWQADGIHVWTEEEAVLFLQQGQARYIIGGASSDHVCDAYSYAQTATTANAGAAATTITVASVTGLVTGLKIGVVLDTGVTFWTTINGAPSGLVVTLAAGLPSSVSSGAVVVAYASEIVKPLKVPAARTLTYSSGNLIPMTVMSRREYMDLPTPTALGTPTQFFYSPRRDHGETFVWPTAQTCAWALRFTWYRGIDTFLLPDETADFPDEWGNALIWNLALQLAAPSAPPDTFQRIQGLAAYHLDIVRRWDAESEDILLQADYQMTMG